MAVLESFWTDQRPPGGLNGHSSNTLKKNQKAFSASRYSLTYPHGNWSRHRKISSIPFGSSRTAIRVLRLHAPEPSAGDFHAEDSNRGSLAQAIRRKNTTHHCRRLLSPFGKKSSNDLWTSNKNTREHPSILSPKPSSVSLISRGAWCPGPARAYPETHQCMLTFPPRKKARTRNTREPNTRTLCLWFLRIIQASVNGRRFQPT